MAEQILSLTEKLRPKDIGTLAGSIKSPNFKYSVLGTIFGIVICTVGFSGIARVFDNGVNKVQEVAKEAAK